MPTKPISFSQHARFEMGRRGISQADVVRMIRRPGQVVPSRKGRSIYQGLIGRGRRQLLRVIVREHTRAYSVVTAYKTSKITKYWRTP
jgi:hypothetical protein